MLPLALALRSGANVDPTFKKVAGSLMTLVIFLVLGGVAALIVGDAVHPKQAIAYGLGWQGTIGGFVQGQRALGSQSN